MVLATVSDAIVPLFALVGALVGAIVGIVISRRP